MSDTNIDKHKKEIQLLVPDLVTIRHNARYTADAHTETLKRTSIFNPPSNDFSALVTLYGLHGAKVVAIGGALFYGTKKIVSESNGKLFGACVALLGLVGWHGYQYYQIIKHKEARNRWQQVWHTAEQTRLLWKKDYQLGQISCNPTELFQNSRSLYQQTHTDQSLVHTKNEDYKTAADKLNGYFEEPDKQEVEKDFNVKLQR